MKHLSNISHSSLVVDALEILSKILTSIGSGGSRIRLCCPFYYSLCIVFYASIGLSPSSWYPFCTISSTSLNWNNTFIYTLHLSQFLPSRIGKFPGNPPLPAMIIVTAVEGRRCNDRIDKMEDECVLSHSKSHK